MRSGTRFTAASILTAAVLLVAPRLSHPGMAGMAGQVTDSLVSVVVLRRVAEAVDGHRTGNLVYVVVDYSPPFEVVGVYESRPEADRIRRRGSPSLGIVGPIRPPLDPPGGVNLITCVHDHYTSAMHPKYCPAIRAVPFDSVAEIAITVHLINGDSFANRLPRGTDAAFFTLSAVDKFAVPYYAKVLGVEPVVSMRQDLVRRLARR